MKSLFCGNLDFDARQSDVERLFRKFGRVDRVDMKSGFAFVYMEDERDADDAIRRLDNIEFGRKGRRIRVEWTKDERGGRRHDSSRKSSSSSKPSKTLFVINFDPINTRTRDIERHFEPYGKISNVRIRRNFSFVQFESQDDATRALEATHMSKFMDRVISVEYAMRDDDERRNGYSPERRGRDASPDGRGYGRGRSPSPYRRDRGSPDYGHGSLPKSRSDRRASPDYGNSRSERRRSPDYGKSRSEAKESPGHGRRSEPRESPDYGKSRSEPKESPGYHRRSEPRESPRHGRRSEPRESPRHGRRSEPKESPGYGGDESPSRERYRSRSRSPVGRERSRS